jgi:hypothetical protein
VDENQDEATIVTLNDGNSAENIALVEGTNYTKNSDAKNADNFDGYNAGSDSDGWYETLYVLDNDLFENDGTYSVNIVTYDAADNRNINTASEAGVISFVVDRTPPVITSNVDTIDIRKPINASEYTVEFKVTELNAVEDSLVVIVDGQEVEYTEVGSNTYQFVLGQKRNHQFTISTQDMAGNESSLYEVSGLTVTTNVVALWFENKPVFWGSVGATALIAGGALTLVIRKSKKEEMEQI